MNNKTRLAGSFHLLFSLVFVSLMAVLTIFIESSCSSHRTLS